MANKLPKLDHVKYVRAKGHVYAYFNTGKKRDGKPIYARLPAPGSIGFFDSYAAMKGARTKQQAVAYTIADLASDYENSPKFERLAKGSQRLYSITLKRITERLGEFPVNDLQTRDVRMVLDNDMAGPGAHNIFSAILGVIYKWAKERGKTDLRPTEGIERLKVDPHEPWPEGMLEEALKAEHDRTRLAVHLLYFTGQWISDVVAMRWTDITDDGIGIRQQKTGKEVWVPLLSELRDELVRTPKRGFTILVNHATRFRAVRRGDRPDELPTICPVQRRGRSPLGSHLLDRGPGVRRRSVRQGPF